MKMGLFDVFKKKGIVLGSPLEGECDSLTEYFLTECRVIYLLQGNAFSFSYPHLLQSLPQTNLIQKVFRQNNYLQPSHESYSNPYHLSHQ